MSKNNNVSKIVGGIATAVGIIGGIVDIISGVSTFMGSEVNDKSKKK